MAVTSEDPLSAPMPDLDLSALADSLSVVWGLEGDLVAVHGERDRNFRVEAGTGRYLLKVHNPADDETALDLQDSALRHIRDVDPDLPVPAVVPTADGRPCAQLTGRDGRPSFARVMTWLEGHHPDPAGLDASRAYDWGRASARLGRALRGFVHPGCSYPIAWDLRRLPTLRTWLPAVDADRRPAVVTVLDRFERRVAGRLPALRAQVVHNDLAPTNVLVDDDWALTGVTDFGDMTHTTLVCDLAVAAADLVASRADGMALVAEVVAGYHSVTALETGEAELVADLVAGRYAASVLITAGRAREQGWAPEIDDEAFAQLEAMLEADLDVLTARFAAPARTPSPSARKAAPAPQRSTEDLLAARARTMGALELSYQKPIHLVAGQGVYLEAADGRRYLDAYNNVPVVGHGHPAVVEAVSAQLATLNTNSRYLQQVSVELAEQLLETLPERFERVLLVNSGSEANDLAWRIARHATGAGGGIATRFAYHGITEAAFAFSPEGWGKTPGPDFMRLVEPPPGAGDVASAVRSLADGGPGVAAMLVDGVFTSDGIRGPAHDWTAEAAAAVHAGGGLYVADEVQAGHGRTGASLWSFLAGNVPADLVTLGKPMGNGYPVAAVIGPGELIDPFIEDTDYFSTFGGGSVACAAALAVLKTVHEEGILDRVSSVGADLRARLHDLAGGTPCVSAVRGWGLAIGVDVVDPATGHPDPLRARGVVDEVRDRGVLIGTTGREGATLKIRPPLVFGPEDVQVLVDALEPALAARGGDVP